MAEQDHLANTEWVDIVNESNGVIAQSSRERMRVQCLRRRAIYVVVRDGTGEILVQRRTRTKDFRPGMLSVITDGIVQAGEQLLESIRRRAEEGLGIARIPFANHNQLYYGDKFCCVQGSLFSCVSHGLFALQEEEISEVHWLTSEEIIIRRSGFTPDSLRVLALWMTRNASNEYNDVEEDE